MKKIIWLVGLLSIFFLCTLKAQAANSCVSNASGNWSVPSTWTGCGGGFPGPADSATIASGHIVVVDVNSAAASLTIGANGAAGGNGVIISAGKVLAITGAVALAIPTAATTDLNVGSGTLTAANISIPGSATANRFATVSVSSGTVIVMGSITFSGSAARARYTSTGASTTNIGGDFGSGGTLTTSGTGTINFNGGGSQTIGTYTTYNNITVNKTGGTLVLSGTTTIGGTLNVTIGIMDIGAFSPTVIGTTTIDGILMISSITGTKIFGNIIINNGGTLNFTAAESATLNGDFTVNGTGTISGTTGTLLFQKVGGGSIGGTSTSLQTITTATFSTNYSNSLKINVTGVTTANAGVTVTNSGTFTAVGALSGPSGTFTQGPNGVLNINSTSAINTLDASANPNDVHYTSTTANQTIHAGTYHNIFIDKSGRVGTLGGPITVNNNLTVSAGTLADGGFQITGNNTGVLTLATGSTLTLGSAVTATDFPTMFTNTNISFASNSTVNYNSNAAQIISNTPVYANLITTATAAVTKTADGPISINGTFTNGANNTFADGGFIITLKDGSVMTGTHTGAGKILFTGGSTVHSVSGAGSYHNVELDDSNGVSQSGTTNISGSLTITNGTWTPNGNTLNVTGDTTVNGAISIVSTAGTKTFGNITINPGGFINFLAAEAVTVNGDLIVNGNGAITGSTGVWTFSKIGGGVISGSAATLTMLGNTTFTTSYLLLLPFTANTMTVGAGANVTNTANVTNSGLAGAGTFTQNAGTVLNLGGTTTITTLAAAVSPNDVHYTSTTAAQTMKGTTYYNVFIDKTGRTATVSGTTNVLGNLVVIAGTLTLGSSILTVSGTTDIYGTIQDINNNGSATFGGLVTIHTGASWDGNPAEACNFTFQNGFVFAGNSFITGSGIYTFTSNNQTLSSTIPLTIPNISIDSIQLTNDAQLVITSALTGTGVLVQAASAMLDLEGTSTVSGFDASAANNTVKYSAASIVTFKAAPYSTLDLSAITNSDITIPADIIVNTELILGTSKLLTNSHKLVLGANASLFRTSGYVIGTIEKQFNTSTAFTFPLGDENNYTPIDLTTIGVASSGSIVVSEFGVDQNDTTSGISPIKPNKSVNRYWSFENDGLSLTSYSAVLNFAPGDIDSGASVANMVVAKKHAGVWAIVPSVCSQTTCVLSGLTTMSDFQIGEKQPIAIITSFTRLPSIITQNTTIAKPQTGNSNTGIESPALFDVASESMQPRTRSGVVFAVIATGLIMGGIIGGLLMVGRRHIKHRKIGSLV